MSLLLIDKPAGPTSHAVVATIKRTLGADKVGHLGTLDPFASGLLPIMIGNTARLSDEAMDGKKGYLFTIGFGRETDTLDPTGRVIAETELPSAEAVARVDSYLANFRGPIEQVPPVYSALKLNGMPLYEYMRGTGQLPIDIETKRRTVTIHSLELVDCNLEQLTLRVVCSKGTYVRSLARDIAKAMGTVGTCIQLRREMVEPWHVHDALPLSLGDDGRISAPEKQLLVSRLLPAWSVAANLPRGKISPELETKLLSGNPLVLNSADVVWEDDLLPAAAGSEAKIFITSGETLFLCQAQKNTADDWKIQPRKRIR